MYKKFYLTTIIIIVFSTYSFSQEAKNAQIAQVGDSVVVAYDSVVTGENFSIELLYSKDGVTWQGPLIQVKGDGRDVRFLGPDKKIIWDASSKSGLSKGALQFKVVKKKVGMPTELTKASSNAKMLKLKPIKTYTDEDVLKYRKLKIKWLGAAALSTGVGVFANFQGKRLYNQYKAATTDAANLHNRVKIYDIISPVTFCMAGFCYAEFLLQARNQNRAEKNLEIKPAAIKGGGGVGISYKF